MAILICNKNGHLSSNDENIYFASESYYNVPGTSSFVHNRIANGVVWGEQVDDVEDDEWYKNGWFWMICKKSSKTNHFLQNGEKVEINNLEVEEKLMFKNKY